MKKLLKGALTLAIATIVGIPQLQAATNDYTIEVKSKKYSKQTTKGFYGINYTEGYSGYGDANWPLVECYTPFVEANDAFIATDETGTSKKFLIRQFGVSMGVVYWINPTQNVIHYWNTFTGEVGTDTPEKGLRGSATPTKHKGLNYVCGDIPGQTGFAYPFSGAQTGIGSVTQDWAGNIVHQWNNVSGAGINTPAQGFAVYRAPEKYGQLIDFEPRLSDMTTQTMPYKRRKIGTDGLLVGNTYDASNFNDDTTPNPNWVGNQIYWSKNEYYHSWNSAYSGSVKKPVDFMGASGNLFDNAQDVPSEYFCGNWGGQIFLTYNGITFGNMFADGQYANWHLNYDLYVNDKPSNVQMTGAKYTNTYENITTAITKYKPGEYSLSTYPREYMFREYTALEYFWILPVSGSFEMKTRNGYKWTFDPRYFESSDGTTTSTANVTPYLPTHERYGYTMSRGYDGMNVPEADSIKGQRVLIHNMWLQYWPSDVAFPKNSKTFNMRDGQIQIRTCPYSGGKPTHAYAQVGYGYGYNKQTNDYVNAGVAEGTPFTATNTSVNCWSELERVNDNVLALYTNVPGKGFSKYYITAVKPNNAVSNLIVAQSWNANGDPVHTLTWTPQADDRATMHTYEVWYRKKKGSTYEDKQTIDGASRDVWNFAGKASVKYTAGVDAEGDTIYTSSYEGCKFEFVAPRGDNGDGTKYERTYEYMVIPVYDASSHRGTEATTSIVTAPAPSKIYGNLYQVTEKNANGETLYGFSIRLDPYFLPGAQGSTEAKHLIITSAGGYEGSDKLKDAMSVTLADGTPLTPQEGITFQSTSAGATTTHGAYALSIDITGKVGADGKLPSIIWHNVNPDLEFQLAAHIESTSDVQYSGTGNLSTTLYVPEPKLTLPDAGFYKLAGDYGTLTENEDMPIGSFRRIDPATNTLDMNPTNPVTLNNANYYGTNGGALSPILVTDEVLGTLNANGEYENNGWRVGYIIRMYDENGTEANYGDFYFQTDAGGWAAVYSNDNNVMCDLYAMEVDYTTETGEDGRVRKIYNPTPKTYKVEVQLEYYRDKDNDGDFRNDLVVTRTTYTELKTGTTTLPVLGVKNATSSAVLGALYQRGGSHFYYDNATSNGYYPYYYDAAMLFNWDEYNSLNRYMGYYGASKAICYGHYETPDRNPDQWVQYHAGSVLPDSEIDLLNIRNNALKDGKIGYGSTDEDGNIQTNWSAQAIKSNQVPLLVHYVHGAETPLESNEAAVSNIKFDVTLTAEYPIVSKNVTGLGIWVAAENPDEYSISGGKMDVLTVPTSLTNMYVNSSSVTTGVEGILVNACGGVKLYPNPVGSTLTLEAPMAMDEVKIFSMDGQLVMVVKDVNVAKATINVDNLPRGVYIVNTLGVAQMMIKE